MKDNYQAPNNNNQINDNNQISNLNNQIKNNDQITIAKQKITKNMAAPSFGHSNLIIDDCLLFGNCDLIIGH